MQPVTCKAFNTNDVFILINFEDVMLFYGLSTRRRVIQEIE